MECGSSWCCRSPSTGQSLFLCFFFNDTATTEIYTLSLHDALPIWEPEGGADGVVYHQRLGPADDPAAVPWLDQPDRLVTLGDSSEDQPGDELARRPDGPALGGLGDGGHGQALPENHGISATLDAQGPSG